MRKVIKLVVVVAVILFQTSSGQKLDVPYGTEWQQGLTQACPKVPVEVTDCTTDDNRCYEHGGGVFKPCWNICPRQDNDPTAQKCPDYCSDYLSDYCVPLSDVPVYTTAPTSTSPPRGQMIPFGWIALIAVIVALLLIIVVFVIYNSCKKSRGRRRYSPNSGPDAERLLGTSPSVQSTAAGGPSAAAAAGEGGTAGSAAQLVNLHGASGNVTINIQQGANSTMTNNPIPAAATAGETSGSTSNQTPADQPSTAPPAAQPAAPPAPGSEEADSAEHRMTDADSGKTPSTEPVTAPVQAPLSQEESGHGNAQQDSQALPQMDSNPPDPHRGNN